MTAIENLLTALRELHADGCLADCYGMTPEEPLGELIERWAEKNYPDASAETSRAVLLMLCGLHDTSMLRSFYDVQPNEPLGEALESWASLGYPGVSSAGYPGASLGSDRNALSTAEWCHDSIALGGMPVAFPEASRALERAMSRVLEDAMGSQAEPEPWCWSTRGRRHNRS